MAENQSAHGDSAAVEAKIRRPIDVIAESVLSGDYVPPRAVEWDAWTDDDRRDFMERLDDEAFVPDRCTCTTWCGESSEAGCPECVWRDIYAPCPVLGFGCGPGCECCTPEQQQAVSRG